MRLLKYPPAWSDSPRLHFILAKFGRPDLFSVFSDADFSDLWLPLSERTIRRLLKGADIHIFLGFQKLCLDDNLPLPLDGRHLFLTHADSLGLEEEKLLGSGGYGEVYSVKHPQSGVRYAMKTISRPGVHRQHLDVMKNFKRELQGIRRIDHPHCVNLVASCTDSNSLILLCSPVADMDLSHFLDSDLSPWQVDIPRRAVGCITSALVYLHAMNIRHDDIKPNNILIHGNKILLTDFGFCLDSSDSGVSTTCGPPTHFVRRYSAPEVLNHEPRSRLTDIWGLGCVLFEIMSHLYGRKLSSMRSFWLSNGTGRDSYADNPAATAAWYASLTYVDSRPQYGFRRRDRLMISFIRTILLEPDRRQRPTAAQILDRLKDMDFVYPVRQTSLWVDTCCYAQTMYAPGSSQPLMQQSHPGTTAPSGLDLDYHFNLVLPHWPILDAWHHDNDLAYIFLDTKFNVIGKSGNFLNFATRDSEGLISFLCSFDKVKDGASSMLQMAHVSPQTLTGADSKGISLSDLMKNLFMGSFANTSSMIFTVDLGSEMDINSQYRTVQLTLSTFCFEQQHSHGRPFFVLVFDPNEGNIVRGHSAGRRRCWVDGLPAVRDSDTAADARYEAWRKTMDTRRSDYFKLLYSQNGSFTFMDDTSCPSGVSPPDGPVEWEWLCMSL
ncbi:kinase-like domain-containing protein [Pyrenochaeta sp. MPI-SDFR-AT-0127]|nr:kinase-like domain-containing protein [Pyrenochaeta sp. MPI-SDFR-AT-0127]